MSKKLENRLIAKRYAKALLGLAGSNAPALAEDAMKLGEAFALPDVLQFLHNPLLSRAQGAEVVDVLLSRLGAPELLKQTIIRMAHNRRLAVAGDMLEQFVQQVEAQQGIIRVKIVSAKALSDNDVSQLSDKIAQAYGAKLRVQTAVDPSIVGGVQLTMGDKQIDYSVAGKLERLGNQLKQTPLASKG